jgi:hypothetical protein
VSNKFRKQIKKATTNVVGLFYGYSTKYIMDWCCVSRVTACEWKKGTRTPSKRSVKLFTLFAHGKVMTRDFDGWQFNDRTGALVSPEGEEFAPGRIRTVTLLYQQVSALEQDKRQLKEWINRLELQLMQQSEANGYRNKATNESFTASNEMEITSEKRENFDS